MAQPTKVELGAFAAGEVPPTLQIAFKDLNGDPVDLTGYTPQMNIEEEIGLNANPLGTGVVVITDGPNGLATYEWVRNDMLDPGKYTAQAWVTNGVNPNSKRFASDLYIYDVYDGPGVPPS